MVPVVVLLAAAAAVLLVYVCRRRTAQYDRKANAELRETQMQAMRTNAY
jgi:hypothetical protein